MGGQRRRQEGEGRPPAVLGSLSLRKSSIYDTEDIDENLVMHVVIQYL